NGSTFTDFDLPGAVGSTFAKGINDSAQVVGSYPFDTSGHGFLRSSDGSAIVIIDEPSASGVSNGGGFGTVATAINGSGQVVGYYFVNNSCHGFLRSSDGSAFTSFDSPGGWCTIPHGINLSGQIVGYFYDANNNVRGFVRSSGGAFTIFDHPNAGAGGTYA